MFLVFASSTRKNKKPHNQSNKGAIKQNNSKKHPTNKARKGAVTTTS